MTNLKFMLGLFLLFPNQAIAQRLSFNEVIPTGRYATSEGECSSSRDGVNVSGRKITVGSSVCTVGSFTTVGSQVQVQMTCSNGQSRSFVSTSFEFVSSKHLSFGSLTGNAPLLICDTKSTITQNPLSQSPLPAPSVRVVDNRSFDTLLPKGYYANSYADCEIFRKDPVEDTVYGLIVNEKHIGYTHAGACDIKRYKAVGSNAGQVTAECGEAGESRRVTTNVSLQGDTFNFGRLSGGGGNSIHFYCGDFRNEARKLMEQSYERSAAGIERIHMEEQKKILERIKKRSVLCRATFIKAVNPWNMYPNPRDPNQDILAEFNVDFKDDAGNVVRQTPSKVGGSIEILSTQNDADPSLTLSGKMVPFLLSYRNYFWPLEALVIDEKSCKPFRG